jgi:hypothetical protein
MPLHPTEALSCTRPAWLQTLMVSRATSHPDRELPSPHAHRGVRFPDWPGRLQSLGRACPRMGSRMAGVRCGPGDGDTATECSGPIPATPASRARRGSLNRRRFLGLLPEPLTPEPRRFARWVNATSPTGANPAALVQGCQMHYFGHVQEETLPAASVGYQLSEGHAFGSRYG